MKAFLKVGMTCFLALAVIGQVSRLHAQENEPPGRRVLIGFKSDVGPRAPQARADAVRRAGGNVHAAFELIPAVAAWLPPQAVAALQRRPDIAYIEDDAVMQAIGEDVVPWGVDRIDADLVWPGGNTGKSINVAVIDTGIDYDHPDLVPIAGGVNYAGWRKDGSTNQNDWNDGHGHGTHCAGIIGARDNEEGVIGVAPEVSLWGVKVLADNGRGYTSDVIQGIEWCYLSGKGIQIASMSLGGGSTTSLKNACDNAYAAGILLIAAAGNDGAAVGYPAAYDSVVAVSATDSGDGLASWSNRGPEIELAAPGVSIYSTYKGGAYATMSGTSMACPHVSGVAALVWGSGISGNTAVRARLTGTAEDLGNPIYFGAGLVDAEKAVGSTEPLPPPAPVAAFSGSPTSGTAPLTVSFTDSSTGSPTSWSWSFGDGGTSTEQNPSHPYTASGTYTVSLTVTNSTGSDTETKAGYITVSAVSRPVAAFSGSPTSGTAPLTVSFTDLSSGSPTSWSWDFGDDETSTAQNPSHDYAVAGIYTVSLTATNSAGSDTVTKTDYITVTEPPAPSTTMHVSSFDVRWKKAGKNFFVYTDVMVVDGSEQPVAGATVEVLITLPLGGAVPLSGITDASGRVTLSVKSSEEGEYNSAVVNVSHSSFTLEGVLPSKSIEVFK